ncbi:hypothetical protein TGS27_2844 [Geobacillus stearothermophilus]|nr:hypothetical protein TGS27_2844 [Geobacillus stearothermophilus]
MRSFLLFQESERIEPGMEADRRSAWQKEASRQKSDGSGGKSAASWVDRMMRRTGLSGRFISHHFRRLLTVFWLFDRFVVQKIQSVRRFLAA